MGAIRPGEGIPLLSRKNDNALGSLVNEALLEVLEKLREGGGIYAPI